MNRLLAVFSATVFATVSGSALADAYSEMQMKPLTPEATAKMKVEVQAAKTKWASMTADQRAEVAKSMRGKKLGELTAMERVAQNDDMGAMSKTQTAQYKSEWDAAKAKYDTMTADEKSALRKATREKRLADLNMMEKVGQNDDMGREF
ncbi:MAG: hypothetical protein ABI981_12300 [Betaproteobacteria bacterium]